MDNNSLPKGIYFEPLRNRYRVRLYKAGRIIHRSYHKDLEAAEEAYGSAKNIQPTKSMEFTTETMLRNIRTFYSEKHAIERRA